MRQLDLEIQSGDDVCRAWLFVARGADEALPCIVMGHGLGLTRRCGLRGLAERFVEAGYVVLLFDYRGFGDSGGEPRQVISLRRQLADWAAVIEHARARPEVDGDRIATWGFSLGAGHALTSAARDLRVAAVVAVAPMFDGLSSTFKAAVGWTAPVALRIAALGVWDLVRALFRRPPALVPLAARPGELGLLTSPDAYPGYRAMVPLDFEYGTAARIGLLFWTYVPGRLLRGFSRPLLVLPSVIDQVNPPGPTLRRLRHCESATVVELSCEHMQIAEEPHCSLIAASTVEFLDRHLRLRQVE